MVRVYANKDIMIFRMTSLYTKEDVSFEQISYYMISGYKYSGDKLEYVDLEIIIDIAEFMKGNMKDVYKLTISYPDISEQVKKAVEEYDRFNPS